MRVLIYGAGGVGLGLGSCLLGAGARGAFLGRPARTAALRAEGLVRSGLFGEARFTPDAFETISELGALAAPVDFVLVATKSFASEDAARDLARNVATTGATAPIVLCQNGWGNAEVFAEHLPKERIFNARVITGFRLLADHHVEVTAHAEPVHVGSLFGAPLAPLASLCEAVANGGIPCELSDTIAEDLWAKMLYNGLLNPLGALMELPYGKLAAEEHARGMMHQLCNEIFRVLAASGHRTHWETPEAYLEFLFGTLLPPTAAHESSMLQDLRAGKRTEIDALTGAVVRLAETHGVEVPTHRTLLGMIRFTEKQQAGD